MRISKLFIGSAAAALLMAAGTSLAQAQGAEAPSSPTGDLRVNRNIVRLGASPTLDWNVDYPAPADDVVEVEDDDTVVTKKKLKMSVRVAGVAFQSGSTHLPAKVDISVGGGNWQKIFLNTGSKVKPNEVLFDQVVDPGTAIDFRFEGASSPKKSKAKTYKENDWRWGYPTYSTGTTSAHKIALTDGQKAPDYAPAYNQNRIESFLASYLEPGDSSTIDIGPRDVIYLVELSNGKPNDWYFDMQDVVVVVNFEEVSSP